MFFQQQLAHPAESRMAQHLNDCSACRSKLDRMQRSIDLFSWMNQPLKETSWAFDTNLDTHLNKLKSSLAKQNNSNSISSGEFTSWFDQSENPNFIGRIGEFELMEVIGRGGMGAVFKAFDRKLERIVAIKVMCPTLIGAKGDTVSSKRFLREAQSVAGINHPNVVSVYSVDQIRGLPYLVMEYVKGESLQQLLHRIPKLRLRTALKISKRVALGLSAAHVTGIIHRDVKPANILIETKSRSIKLTDFGLARTSDNALTESGHLMGTPEFLAPEQFRFAKLDHRVDLFSLGSVMYQLLTGQVPFRAQSPHAIMNQICHQQPTSMLEVAPNVPDSVAALVDRLLQKDPNDRPDSASDVANSIQELLDLSRRPSKTEPAIANVSKKTKMAAKEKTKQAWSKSKSLTFLATLAVITLSIAGWLLITAPVMEASNEPKPSASENDLIEKNKPQTLKVSAVSTPARHVTVDSEVTTLHNRNQWTEFFERLETSGLPTELTIELAFDEMVEVSPIEIVKRSVTMVPASGFQPKISFELRELEPCILVEEGSLEMKDIIVSAGTPEAIDEADAEEFAGIVQTTDSSLKLTHCGIKADGRGCLNLEESDCKLENCKIISNQEVSIHFATESDHLLEIEGSLLTGKKILSIEPVDLCHVELHRNNFVGEIGIALFLAESDEARVDFQTSENVFNVSEAMMSLEEVEVEFEDESEICEVVSWDGEANKLPKTLLRFFHGETDRWSLIESADRFSEIGFSEIDSTRSKVKLGGQDRLVQKR